MEYQGNFKLLNIQMMKRKVTEDNKKGGEFLVLNVLDYKNNPCKFFVFSDEIIAKIKNSTYSSLQDLLITFELTYTTNWNVKLVDVQ